MTIDESTIIIKKITKKFNFFWCVAGGWAIDLYLNRVTRDHEDFEIILLRADQTLYFPELKPHCPKKIFTGEGEPVFKDWNGELIDEEVIQLRLNSINSSEGLKEFDILLTPSMDNEWICRRDESIKFPLETVRIFAASGIPVLSPDLVLLFKAKYLRDKDRIDFEAVLPHLDLELKCRLKKNLERIHPHHEWISELAL
jgi:hypothetical protein